MQLSRLVVILALTFEGFSPVEISSMVAAQPPPKFVPLSSNCVEQSVNGVHDVTNADVDGNLRASNPDVEIPDPVNAACAPGSSALVQPSGGIDKPLGSVGLVERVRNFRIFPCLFQSKGSKAKKKGTGDSTAPPRKSKKWWKRRSHKNKKEPVTQVPTYEEAPRATTPVDDSTPSVSDCDSDSDDTPLCARNDSSSSDDVSLSDASLSSFHARRDQVLKGNDVIIVPESYRVHAYVGGGQETSGAD